MSPLCQSALENTTAVVAAIDQGTQSSRFTIYGTDLKALWTSKVPLTNFFPLSGYCEQDPLEILDTVKQVMQDAYNTARKEHNKRIAIQGIGITNQRETTVAWDRFTGKPLYRAIVWSDTRTKDVVDGKVAQFGTSDAFRDIAGLPINTYFSAVKMRWMIDNVAEVREAVASHRCYFGTVDTWLTWNLTGGIDGGVYVTDVTNASRTLLMNIHTCQWDDTLLKAFEIPRSCLPEIRSCAEIFGTIQALPDFNGIPICGIVGDQQAACIGQGLFSARQVKCTYGTGAFILMHTGEKPVASNCGLLTTVCYKLGPNATVNYALEGAIASAGSAVTWLKDNLKAIRSPEETEPLIKSVRDTGGVYFVPAFSGLFAPRWRQDARSVVMGMTQFTKRAHIVRALVESVGFQLNEITDAMLSDMVMDRIELIRVDGGMSMNAAFLQITADLCGTPVERPVDVEVTCLGAAIAAGFGCGLLFSEAEVENLIFSSSTRWEPRMKEDERQSRIQMWDKAVKRSYNWV